METSPTQKKAAEEIYELTQKLEAARLAMMGVDKAVLPNVADAETDPIYEQSPEEPDLPTA